MIVDYVVIISPPAGVPFALRAFQWPEVADNSIYVFQDTTL